MASKLGKEIQIYEAHLIVLVLRVCDEPVETGKHICVELGGKDIQVRWRKPRGGAQALSSFHSGGRPGDARGGGKESSASQLLGSALLTEVAFPTSVCADLFQDVKCISYCGYIYRKSFKFAGWCCDYFCFRTLLSFLTWQEK